MNTVGADQHVALGGCAMGAGAIEKISGDTGVVLPERAEAVAHMEALFAEPRARRLVNHALQAPSMDRELRHVVAGIEPARFAPNLLPEAIGVGELARADRDRVEPFQQPELLEFL